MKAIVAGSRTIDDYDIVASAIGDSPWAVHNLQHGERIEEIVHGGAKGVDRLGGEFADKYGLDCVVFEPNWDRYGSFAGPRRNTEMAEYADALIAIWDGQSSGTRDMITKALDHGLDVYVEQHQNS